MLNSRQTWAEGPLRRRLGRPAERARERRTAARPCLLLLLLYLSVDSSACLFGYWLAYCLFSLIELCMCLFIHWFIYWCIHFCKDFISFFFSYIRVSIHSFCTIYCLFLFLISFAPFHTYIHLLFYAFIHVGLCLLIYLIAVFRSLCFIFGKWLCKFKKAPYLLVSSLMLFFQCSKKTSHLLVGKTWITLNTAAIRASLVPLLLLLFVYRLSNFLSSLFIYTCVLYQ